MLDILLLRKDLGTTVERLQTRKNPQPFLNVEAFHIGAEYVSIMAARRESDVLLTEGHDATWALPGPANATYGIWGGMTEEERREEIQRTRRRSA